MYILVYAYEKESSPQVVYKEDEIGNVYAERLETPKILNEGEETIGYMVLGQGETQKDAYDYMIKQETLTHCQDLYDAPDFECGMLDTYDSFDVLKERTGYYYIKVDDDYYEWLSNSSYYGYSAIEMSDLIYTYDIFLEKSIDWDEEDSAEEASS